MRDSQSHKRRRRLSGFAQRATLLLVSLLISALCAEAAWRLMLASETKIGSTLRQARYYADPFSEDLFWLLRHRWSTELSPPEEAHPLLGWHSREIGADLSHRLEDWIGGRRPVLLYGDSFAQTVPGARRFENILNRDERFSDGHYMLNYGVGGYGLDQIYLLFKNSIDRFEDPFVIFSFMTYDLDRSLLSVRVGQKPYFEVSQAGLELRGTPIEPNPQKFFDAHPPRVGSYVLRRLSRIVELATGRAGDRAIERKKEINGAILDAAITELEARDLDYVIFVFHPRQEFVQGPSWRSTWLREKLEASGVPYVWSYDVLEPKAKTGPIDDLFDPGHRHPNSETNRLLAQIMAESVLTSGAEP